MHGDELEKEREREAVGGTRSVGRNVVRSSGGRQEAGHEINAANMYMGECDYILNKRRIAFKLQKSSRGNHPEVIHALLIRAI